MLASLFLLAGVLQAPDSGAFVITLGQDTIGVERYTRTADRVVDDMVMRDRAPVIARHLVGDLGADGLITHLDVDNKPLGTTDVPASHVVARFTKDDAFIDVTKSGQTSTAHVVTPQGAVPFINFCYALYDQYGVRARTLRGSPVKVPVLSFGSTAPFDLTVTFPAPDSMGVAFEGDQPTLFKLDAAGRIQGGDGRLTTQKVIARRVPVSTIDVAAYAAAFAERPLGQLSPADSVRAEVGGVRIAIDYGRPAMRGRRIFGGVVPWNQVWRTGANFATRFTTSVDLVIGGKTIPKGSYTLWTLPSPSGWKLIVNREVLAPCGGDACNLPTRARLWGTDYSADSDLVRVAVKTESLPQAVEQFTIAVVPQGKAGVVQMDWETTRISIPFERKRT
ncbi:MAG TPA: DUF2911 domain-containing protein [Gemmatimonadales bacterium]|nr:DUF2911 domain-containing protein [Gemmatimonadales bacterium]